MSKPTLSTPGKRGREASTPDSLEKKTQRPKMAQKVGDMSVEDLTTLMSGMLASHLQNLATKEEVQRVEQSVQDLRADNESLRQEVEQLKSVVNEAREHAMDLEGRSRRNNLIFGGLQHNGDNVDWISVVLNFCKNVLGVDGTLMVNRAHALGPVIPNCPIIAHIPRDGDIAKIFAKVKTLKGTGFNIRRDFTRPVRMKRSKLLYLRKKILEKVSHSQNVKLAVIFDHLCVQGRKLFWDLQKNILYSGKDDGVALIKNLLQVDISVDVEAMAGEGDRRRRSGDDGVIEA